MASLTYVCFVPAKGLIRDLSANSSTIAFEVPLAGTKHTYVRLAIIIHRQILAFFQVCEWHITQLGIFVI